MEPQHEILHQLDTPSITKILQNTGEFAKGTLSGIEWFINNAAERESLILGGDGSIISRGVRGPGLAARDFGKKVIVPLMKIAVGRLLNVRQMNNLGALMRLVSVLMRPETLPQAQAEFHMVFEVTEQRLAQPGNLSTVAGGASTTSYDLIINLERKVVSIEIDSQEIFCTNDPLVMAQAIAAELESAETTWDLTLLVEHAKYCARQPLLVELCQLKDAAKNNDSTEGVIISVCQLENLVCGALNRQPHNFISLIHTGLKIIDGTPSNSVVVTTSTVFRNGSLDNRLASLSLEAPAAPLTYSVNGAVGMSSIARFGRPVPELAPGRLQVSNKYPKIYNPESKSVYGLADEPPEPLKVAGVNLGHNEHIPVVPLDGTKFSADGGMSVEDTLTQGCVKRLFFTVGTCPVVYGSVPPESLYGESGKSSEITPEAIALRSPSSSYIMNHDQGCAAQEVSLELLHRLYYADNPDAFDVGVFARKLRGVQAIRLFDEEQSAALLLEKTWEAKVENQQSVFEFDPRHMLINHRGGRDEPGGVNVVAVEGGDDRDEFIRAIPRVCMYNSSPMSMLQNELVGVLATMYQLAPPTQEMTRYLSMIKTALEDGTVTGLEDVAALRLMGLTGGAEIDEAMVHRLFNAGENYLPLSDPYCQLVLIDRLERFMRGIDAGGEFYQALPVLRELVTVMRGGVTGVISVFEKLFSNTAFSIYDPDVMINSLCQTPRGTPEQNLFLNVVYGAILPLFSNRLARLEADRHFAAEEVHIQGLVYKSYGGACFVGRSHRLPAARIEILWEDDIGTAAPVITRPLWKQRVAALRNAFGGTCPYVGFLGGLHCATRLDRETVTGHFDKKYYSGMAYMCVRTTRFNGHGMCVIPRGSARLITGNMYAGTPVSEPVGKSVWTQCMEFKVAPSGIDKLGVLIPNVLCTELNGMGVSFNVRDLNAIVILEAYNGFTPESKTTSAHVHNILPICGRYDATGDINYERPDIITHRYSQCPTLLHRLANGFDKLQRVIEERQLPPEHSYSLVIQSTGRGNVFATLPPVLHTAELMTEHEILKRTLDATPEDRNLYRPTLGIIFSDNYVIGKNGSYIFRQNQDTQPPMTRALAPKILGESMVNGVSYGDMEYGFAIKLAKYTGVSVSVRTDINAY
uniref:Polyprotein n=1 Tax=Latid herpesvirus 1 TaxID=3096545 RepID=A0AB33V6U5_9VIRU